MQLFRRVLDCAPYSCFLFKKWLQQGRFPGGIISNKKSMTDSYFGSNLQHNGHIFIDSPMIRRQNSTGNVRVRGNYSDLKGESTWKLWHRFNVQISKWFRLSKSTKYRMSSPHEFFYFVSTWNWCNFSTRCFHSIISEHFQLWEPIPCYSDIELSPCNFSDINVITDIGTIVATSFRNFAATQINRNKDNFYFLQNKTNKYYNANLYKY